MLKVGTSNPARGRETFSRACNWLRDHSTAGKERTVFIQSLLSNHSTQSAGNEKVNMLWFLPLRLADLVYSSLFDVMVTPCHVLTLSLW